MYPAALKSPAVAGPYYPTVATDDNSTANRWGASQGTWDLIKTLDALPVSNSTAIGTLSSSIIATGFNFNIDLNRSIAGIKVEVLQTAAVPDTALTCRLQKTASVGPRVAFRRKTVGNLPAQDITYGESTDTWDEPYLPAEINNIEFGVAMRLEDGSQVATCSIDAVRMTIYSTDQVLPAQDYPAATYSFGPTAIPTGRSLLTFWVDTSLHLSGAISFTLNVEISYDSGANWAGFATGARVGQATATHPSGQADNRFILYRSLDSSGAGTQFRGTFTISGGRLITGVGVYSS
jgi:hypothetical protein